MTYKAPLSFTYEQQKGLYPLKPHIEQLTDNIEHLATSINNTNNALDQLKNLLCKQLEKSNNNTNKQSAQANTNDLSYSIIKDPEDEPSKAFLAIEEALKIDKDDNYIKAAPNILANLTLAPQDPLVRIYLATESLMEKDYELSEEHLCNALLYGIKEQKLCNNLFAGLLFEYMHQTITIVNNERKLRLISIIKEALEINKIDLNTFCGLYETYAKSPLSFCSEQSKVTISEQQPTKKESKAQQTNTNDLNNSIIKDPEDEPSEVFLAIQRAIDEKNYTKAKLIADANLKTLGEDPFVYIYVAIAELMEKDYEASERCLCFALAYGIKQQKLCSNIFGNLLFEYIHQTIKTITSNQRKQSILSIIRKELVRNKIDLAVFCDQFKTYAGYPLSFNAQ